MDKEGNMEDAPILIMTYGSWGSELHTTKNTLEEAKECARLASIKDPRNEYVVELEPGGFDNPMYKAGEKIG